MQELCDGGFCPALVNDDNGKWAVTFLGMQSVVSEDEPHDVSILSVVEAKSWHEDIRQALIISLKE